MPFEIGLRGFGFGGHSPAVSLAARRKSCDARTLASMRKGVLWRSAFLMMSAAAVIFFRPEPARAAQLGCPVVAMGFLPANPQSSVFGFRLVATGPKKAGAGEVALDTNRGWFRLAFSGTGLFYARFPEPVTIRTAWVEKVGGTQCYPPHANWQEFSAADGIRLRRAPSNRDAVLAATIREPYGRNDCSQPFAPVHALTVVLPDFLPKQATFPGTAQIDVVVMPDGKVSGASVLESSGTGDFDSAALDAARKSTYAPALAYCLPTVAHYIYKATLHP